MVDGCIKYLVASKVNAPVLQLSGLRRKVSGKVFRFKDGVTDLRHKVSLQYDTDGKVAPKPVEGKEQDAGTLTEGL